MPKELKMLFHLNYREIISWFMLACVHQIMDDVTERTLVSKLENIEQVDKV